MAIPDYIQKRHFGSVQKCLEPCPSCNGLSIVIVPLFMAYAVTCQDCGMSGPGRRDIIMAARVWNALPQPSDIAELVIEVKRLQAELESIAQFDEYAKFKAYDKAMVIPAWRLAEAIDDMRKIARRALGLESDT